MEENKSRDFEQTNSSSEEQSVNIPSKTGPVSDVESKLSSNAKAPDPSATQENAKRKRKIKARYILGLIALALIMTAVVVILVIALSTNTDDLTEDETQQEEELPPEDNTPETPPEQATTYSEGLEYMLSNDGSYYIVSGWGSCDDVQIRIPPTYQDKPVMTIGTAAFEYNTRIVSVHLPESITRIEAGAFNGCKYLLTINIHDGITYIGRDAFKTCVRLDKKTICDNIEYIGTETNPYYFLVEVQNGKSYDIDTNTKVICSNAFAETLITEINVPEGVEIINYGAFAECYVLKKVTLPESVRVIEEGAFGNCTSLVYNEYDNGLYLGSENNPYFALIGVKDRESDTLIINEQTEIIVDKAMYGLGALKNITLPKSIRIIGARAFGRCSLAHVYYGGSREDFANIIIREENLGFKNATIHFDFAE